VVRLIGGDLWSESPHSLGLRTSSARQRQYTIDWVDDAVDRGEKVYYKCRLRDGTPVSSVQRPLPR
jgi:hypothetical protein